MQLSPEVRKRKVRDVAERHGWTIPQTEEQVKSLRERVVTSEAAILEALAQMKPDELRRGYTL